MVGRCVSDKNTFDLNAIELAFRKYTTVYHQIHNVYPAIDVVYLMIDSSVFEIA